MTWIHAVGVNVHDLVPQKITHEHHCVVKTEILPEQLASIKLNQKCSTYPVYSFLPVPVIGSLLRPIKRCVAFFSSAALYFKRLLKYLNEQGCSKASGCRVHKTARLRRTTVLRMSGAKAQRSRRTFFSSLLAGYLSITTHSARAERNRDCSPS